MAVATQSDLSKDPIYAELLVKIHLLNSVMSTCSNSLFKQTQVTINYSSFLTKWLKKTTSCMNKCLNSSKNKSGLFTGSMDKKAKA